MFFRNLFLNYFYLTSRSFLCSLVTMSSELVKKDSNPIESEDRPKPTAPLLKRTTSQIFVLQAQNLVLWKKPLSTVYHFVQCLYDNTMYLYSEVVRNKCILFCGIIVLISFCFLDKIEGPHQVSALSSDSHF